MAQSDRQSQSTARKLRLCGFRPLLETLESREVPAAAVGLTSLGSLIRFDTATPGTTTAPVVITGLQPAEAILAIDFRPADLKLYGLGDTGRLYTIADTGVATQVGAGVFDVPLQGASFGFDFNPTVDRIRVVSDMGQNFRINPNTGKQVDSDMVTAGTQIDPQLMGDSLGFEGAAYTNNFLAGPNTVLFGIDQVNSSFPGKLSTINTTTGATTFVGSLGIASDDLIGFDISAQTGIAFATLTNAATSQLVTINLTTGAATTAGQIGALPTELAGLAILDDSTILYATNGLNLVQIRSSNPTAPEKTTTITGLDAGEELVGLDVRPATGQIYGLTSKSRVAIIDPVSGLATKVGATPFAVLLDGTAFGFDFNPSKDLIRITSDTGQNLRVNPRTGEVVDGDANIAGIQGDAKLNGTTINVSGNAYTNNFAGAATTKLLGIDAATDKLVTIDPPNAGTTSTPLPLGIDITAVNGFDISGEDGTAFAALTVGATTSLFTINQLTGAAQLLGAIGTGTAIKGLTAISEPRTVTLFGVDTTNNLVSFQSNAPDTITATKAITGLQPMEMIVGIDFRPSDGKLYAVGDIPTMRSQLYTVNPATGAATAVGTPFTPILNGTSFGVDFNPMVDKLRIVSDTSQNLRIDPTTGAVVGGAADPTINGGTTALTGAAYTNNFAGTTATTLYVIDPTGTGDSLFIQNPANMGTTTLVGKLGVDADFVNGFDISAIDNTGYASLTIGTATNLYRINLATGAASLIAPIGTGATQLRGLTATVPGQVQFSVATQTVAENVGTTKVTINRVSSTAGPASVTVAVTGGTATADDFSGLPQTVNFADGETTKDITLTIVDDTTTEADETIILTLTTPELGTSIGETATQTVTISANDPVTPVVPPPASISTTGIYAVGSGQGSPPRVTVFNADGSQKASMLVFDAGFTGGVRTAYADVTGDKMPDLIAATGPGSAPIVRIFDGVTNQQINEYNPFETSFTGGLYVTAGDFTGDGKAEVVVTPDQGGGPRVQIRQIDGTGGSTLADFFAIDDKTFFGGARAAVGDINNDGKLDLFVGAGFGGGPRVAGFNGASLTPGQTPPKLFNDFFVFEQSLRNGVFVASGDLNNDKFADLIVGGGPGGGPRVFAVSGKDALTNPMNQTQLINFFAGDANNRGGIRLAVKDLDGDGFADLVTGAGDGGGTAINTYLGKSIPQPNGTPTAANSFNAFNLNVPGGVFVG